MNWLNALAQSSMCQDQKEHQAQADFNHDRNLQTRFQDLGVPLQKLMSPVDFDLQ